MACRKVRSARVADSAAAAPRNVAFQTARDTMPRGATRVVECVIAMMNPMRQAARLWWLGMSGLVILLALALAAGGVTLALRQGRAVEQTRIQGLRDRAESVSNRIHNDLYHLVEQRILTLRQAFSNRDDGPINRMVETHPWVELAFVYDRRTLITWPATTVARSDRPHEAFAPPGFGLAEQLEFADQRLDEAVELYKRCTGEGTPVYWQLRAYMAIAGCRSKQKQFDEAIEIYQRLRTRYTLVLRSLDEPSLFSVNLALIDVLATAGRREEAARTAESLLHDVTNGHVPLPAREYADLLVNRLKLLTHFIPVEIQEVQHELAEVAARQHQLSGAVGVVRTWMEPRLDPPLGRQEPGVQFIVDTLGARPRALAYRRFDSGGYETVVGLCIYLPALCERMVLPVVRTSGGDDLALHKETDTVSGGRIPWSQTLASPLQAWQIQPSSIFIDRVAREVRRQTGVYIALTLVASLTILGATIALLFALRRQMALARLKSEFVANVSHELKTPLSMIRLFGETLLSGRAGDEAKRREYYGVISRESERLSCLIDNILDFSRIDAGRKHYQRTECDVGQVVRKTVDAYRLQLDHHGFICRVDIAADLPIVHADPDAVSQAVLNLLSNAVKYSPDNRDLGIRVEAARENRRKGVRIIVSDRGIGIPPEERGRLFEGFFRGSHEVVRATRGTGLGLTLVRHIVAEHDGEIRVESTPGVGSTFTIFLPETNGDVSESS